MSGQDEVDGRTGWEQRLLRPASEGRWVERRNLALADYRDTATYPCRLTVAINWDGPTEDAGEGLIRAEQAVVAALARDALCLHVLTFVGDDECDLVFYTRSADHARATVEALARELTTVDLIPEFDTDAQWSYYRSRLTASRRRRQRCVTVCGGQLARQNVTLGEGWFAHGWRQLFIMDYGAVLVLALVWWVVPWRFRPASSQGQSLPLSCAMWYVPICAWALGTVRQAVNATQLDVVGGVSRLPFLWLYFTSSILAGLLVLCLSVAAAVLAGARPAPGGFGGRAIPFGGTAGSVAIVTWAVVLLREAVFMGGQ